LGNPFRVLHLTPAYASEARYYAIYSPNWMQGPWQGTWGKLRSLEPGIWGKRADNEMGARLRLRQLGYDAAANYQLRRAY
jgi:hypothetical protein